MFSSRREGLETPTLYGSLKQTICSVLLLRNLPYSIKMYDINSIPFLHIRNFISLFDLTLIDSNERSKAYDWLCLNHTTRSRVLPLDVRRVRIEWSYLLPGSIVTITFYCRWH